MTTFIPPTDPFFQSPGAKQAETIIAKGLATAQAGQKTVRAALTALKPQLQALLDQYKTGA